MSPAALLVALIVTAAWPAGTDARWTGGAATPADAVAAYRAAVDYDRSGEALEVAGIRLAACGGGALTALAVRLMIG